MNGLPFLALSSLPFFLKNTETTSNLFFPIVRKIKIFFLPDFWYHMYFSYIHTSLIPYSQQLTQIIKIKFHIKLLSLIGNQLYCKIFNPLSPMQVLLTQFRDKETYVHKQKDVCEMPTVVSGRARIWRWVCLTPKLNF